MAKANGAEGEGGRVKVYARVRPKLEREYGDHSAVVADESTSECRVSAQDADAVDKVLAGNSNAASKLSERSFAFDGAFGEEASQKDVFEQVGKPVLRDVMQGYNGCVFAYGQTGSGKTHSLLHVGSSADPSDAGLLPRLAASLFVHIGGDTSHTYEVECGMLQVYNEQVDDLLGNDESARNLQVVGNSNVKGLKWVKCSSPDDLLKAFERGRNNLVYAETQLNKASSRSHAVFQMKVQKRPRATSETKAGSGGSVQMRATFGKLTVVDLAGSERVKRSGAQGQQLKEAANINTSLLTLGNVVQALAERKKHIPVRDSKLTRILEDSIGGNCKTSLLVCCSPAMESSEETVNSLEFASRAMKVETHAVVNEGTVEVDSDRLAKDLAGEGLSSAVQQKHKQLKELEDKMQEQAHNSQKDVEETKREMERLKTEHAKKIDEKHREIEKLKIDVESAKEESEKTKTELDMAQRQLQETQDELKRKAEENERERAELQRKVEESKNIATDHEKRLSEEVEELRRHSQAKDEAIEEERRQLQQREEEWKHEREQLEREKQSAEQALYERKSELEAAMNEKEEERRRMESEAESSEARVKELEEAKMRSQQEHADALAAKEEEVQQKLLEKDSEIEWYAKQAEEAGKRIQNMEEQLKEQQRLTRAAEDEKKETTKKHDELNQELEYARSELERKQASIESLQQRVSEEEEHVQHERSEVEHREQEKAELQRELEREQQSKAKEERRLQHLAAFFAGTRNRLEEEKEKKESEKREAFHEVEVLKQRFENRESRADDVQKIAELRKQVESLERKNEELARDAEHYQMLLANRDENDVIFGEDGKGNHAPSGFKGNTSLPTRTRTLARANSAGRNGSIAAEARIATATSSSYE